MNNFYKPRITDKLLKNALQKYGAVYIRGPRACGKTTTARQISARNMLFQNAKTLKDVTNGLDSDPMALLNGPKPILLDEWQLEPRIWGTVSAAVQESGGATGSYILTGSTFLNPNRLGYNASDSITTIDMWTMSLFESGDSTGEISLLGLINNPDSFKEGCLSRLTKDDIVFVMCRGGWPGSLRYSDKDEQLNYSRNILNRILDRKLYLENGNLQNRDLTEAILCAYAKSNCMLTKPDKIYNDVRYAEENTKIIDMHIRALNSIYLIEDISRWNIKTQPMRTKKQSKHVITDPSIAVAELDMGPQSVGIPDNSLIRGFLFECLCIRDIKIYASAFNFEVSYSYYRGEDNDEIDIVLHERGECRALIECKLSERDIGAAEYNLLELEKKIMEENAKSAPHMGERPHLLKIVLTGTEVTKKLDSGVLVIPLGCLKD